MVALLSYRAAVQRCVCCWAAGRCPPSHPYCALIGRPLLPVPPLLQASNPLVMVQAYRLLAEEQYNRGWDYPLHLGVTEAGAWRGRQRGWQAAVQRHCGGGCICWLWRLAGAAVSQAGAPAGGARIKSAPTR